MEQVRSVVQSQQVNSKLQPLVYGLFLDERAYGIYAGLDHRTVRRNMPANYFNYRPGDQIPGNIDRKNIMGLDTRSLHTPPGINRDAFWGAGNGH